MLMLTLLKTAALLYLKGTINQVEFETLTIRQTCCIFIVQLLKSTLYHQTSNLFALYLLKLLQTITDK